MIIHPNINWLNEIVAHVHDPQWRHQQLESILESLPHYLLTAEYVIPATDILTACHENMIVQSRYDELAKLYETALDTIDSDPQIPPQSAVVSHYEDNLTLPNRQRFSNEYFELRYYLAQVYLKQRQADKTSEQLQHLLDLMPTTNSVNQLRAHCFLLDFHSYGYSLNYDFDPVKVTLQLADLYPQLKLNAEIAVGHYHYSRGDTKQLRASIRRIEKSLAEAKLMGWLDAEDFNKITAEQYFYLAIMYRELGDCDQAEINLNRASSRYVAVNNNLQNMLILYEQSQLYMEQNQLEKALQWNGLALREYHQLDVQDDFYQAMLEHGRGSILYCMKKYQEVIPLVQRAIPIWRQYKHEYHTALALNALGASQTQLNLPEQALPHLVEARDICSTLTDKQYAQELLKLINKNIAEANNRLS